MNERGRTPSLPIAARSALHHEAFVPDTLLTGAKARAQHPVSAADSRASVAIVGKAPSGHTPQGQKGMERETGLEPATCSLEGCRSTN
jgi:hypothetical protein